jgi:RNase P/RNase MRP subunit POP5
MKNSLIILGIILIFLSSCKKDAVTEPENFGYDCFPLEIGNSWNFSFKDYAGVNYDWNDYDGTINWIVSERITKNDTTIFTIIEEVNGRKISYIPYPLPAHYDTSKLYLTNLFLIKETSDKLLIFAKPNYFGVNIKLKRYYDEEDKYAIIKAEFERSDYRRFSIELMHNVGIIRMSIRPAGNSGRRPDIELLGYDFGDK